MMISDFFRSSHQGAGNGAGRRAARELAGRGGQALADHGLARRVALLVLERAVRGAVDRRARLLTPAIGQRAIGDRAIADLVEEALDGGLRRRAVTGDREVAAVRRARR